MAAADRRDHPRLCADASSSDGWGGPKRVRELLPPPTPAGAPALELKWAHVLADFNFASFRTGSLSNIVDYLRIPRRDRDLALRGYTLAMLLEGRDG
jgi:hypothetical protein